MEEEERGFDGLGGLSWVRVRLRILRERRKEEEKRKKREGTRTCKNFTEILGGGGREGNYYDWIHHVKDVTKILFVRL